MADENLCTCPSDKPHPCLMAVMAPLKLKNHEWEDFKSLLKEAKDIGVEAVTVDMWWGHVMKERGQPDWKYYKDLFNVICMHGLRIVPIFSMHHGGGSVGDGDLNEPIPRWVYDDLSREAGLRPDDLRYISEKGRVHSDAVPVWATTGAHGPIVLEAMADFFRAFTKEEYFQRLAQNRCFPELNISLGPAGELRYPSYNLKHADGLPQSDEWSYPHRGFFQCYGDLAQRSFRDWAKKRLEDRRRQNLQDAEDYWVSHFVNDAHPADPFHQIRPPGGEKPADGQARADDFVSHSPWLSPNKHERQYAEDFITWYNECLITHGYAIMTKADSCLAEGAFREIPLGMKIPGVHWQWRCTDVPRMAEMTAGLIPLRLGVVRSRDDQAPDGMRWLEDGQYPIETGYDNIFNMVRKLKASFASGRDVTVYFTALEMDDDWDDCGSQDDHKTSRARTLVRCAAKAAQGTIHQQPVTLRGENALSRISSDGDPDTDWREIACAFEVGRFTGFTLLRLDKQTWYQEKEKFRQFIKTYDFHRP
ncbi:MAG: family 14 glycosylhydrolase [Magnetococcales bacterium]|nr:family 14 glycosylhydrolase [Magnetococcales bacterium]